MTLYLDKYIIKIYKYISGFIFNIQYILQYDN
jgi:hypothetical protein